MFFPNAPKWSRGKRVSKFAPKNLYRIGSWIRYYKALFGTILFLEDSSKNNILIFLKISLFHYANLNFAMAGRL
jgi:hypothetical protein